jgi:hypothetical protein
MKKTFRGVYKNKYGDICRGNINCSHKGLESLEGSPKYVDGSFHCNSNELQTLEGAPIFVSGVFNCEHNSDLESLEGAPKYVHSFNVDEKFFRGENVYTIITSIIRGRYDYYSEYMKDLETFREDIFELLIELFTEQI